MVHDPDLLDRLEQIGTNTFEGEVWRHMFAGFDPARPNTRGARWNPPGVAAVYTSLERATVLAEAEHMIAAQPVRPHAARHVYRMAIQLRAVADLTAPGVLTELDIDETTLADVDHGPCRRVGGAAHWLDCDGLLVPSARTAAGTNLVVFTDRLAVDATFDVISTEVID